MSSKNNVNKDFYTLAGRDRPNEVVIEPKHRPGELLGHRGGARPNFIPGAAPVGEAPARNEGESPTDEREPLAAARAREAQMSAEKTGTRSGSQKQASARRGGKAPGKARPKAGAFGDARRKSQDTVRAKRGTTRAQPSSRSRRRAA